MTFELRPPTTAPTADDLDDYRDLGEALGLTVGAPLDTVRGAVQRLKTIRLALDRVRSGLGLDPGTSDLDTILAVTDSRPADPLTLSIVINRLEVSVGAGKENTQAAARAWATLRPPLIEGRDASEQLLVEDVVEIVSARRLSLDSIGFSTVEIHDHEANHATIDLGMPDGGGGCG